MTAKTTRPSYRGFYTEVLGMCDLSQTFRRLTLTGPDLHDFGDTLLDQRIKLILASGAKASVWPLDDAYSYWRSLPDEERPAMRTYTVAGIDRVRRELLVDIACRPVHGPASQFALDARRGDPVVVVGPDARSSEATEDGVAWRPGAARDLVVVGDETALPAIRNILRVLPHESTGLVVLEVPTISDATELAVPRGIELSVVRRHGAPMAAAAARVAALTGGSIPVTPAAADDRADLIWDETEGASAGRYGWLAGEAGGVMALRRELLERRALTRGSASFMGYWRRGRAEDSG